MTLNIRDINDTQPNTQHHNSTQENTMSNTVIRTANNTVIPDKSTAAVAKAKAAHETRATALKSLQGSGTTRKTELVTELFALVNERNSKIYQGTQPDPRFTDDANREAAESARAKAIEQYAPKIAAIVDRAAKEARWAKEDAAKHQAYDLNDPAVLIRSEQSWNHVVRPKLEAGATIFEAVATADVDSVAAVQRFAPAWLEQNERDNSEVHLAVAARLADLAPTEKAAKEIRAGVTVDHDAAIVESIATITSGATGRLGGESISLSQMVSHEFGGAQFGIDQSAGVPAYHFHPAGSGDAA